VDETPEQRPSKRRKTAHLPKGPRSDTDVFPRLLGDHEDPRNAQERLTSFQRCSTRLRDQIAHILKPTDAGILDNIAQFVKDAPAASEGGRLLTGLIVSGPNIGSQARLLDQWRSAQPDQNSAIVLSLEPTQMPNLMIALKNIVRSAIIQLDGPDGYATFLNDRKRRIQMSYDLELLKEFVVERQLQKCVIYLTDIEAIDTGLLTDIISVLSAWADRIPIVLLLGISTTVELFEARLPKSTIRLLDCTLFDVNSRAHSCREVYETLQKTKKESFAPTLGPVVSNVLLEMAREQDTTAASFSKAIQYATMSHFFANPLSVLLAEDLESVEGTRHICEAIRNTDSFRAHAEERLDAGEAKTVRSLLNDDKALLDAAKEAVNRGQAAMSRHNAAASFFETLLEALGSSDQTPDSFAIQVQALSGPSFLDSELYTDLISRLTTLPSDTMRRVLTTIQANHNHNHLAIDTQLQQLDKIVPPTSAPLRTAHDPSHTTTTTTIKNNKVHLSKHGPKLSLKETAYTALVESIVDILSTYFESTIINPTTLFMHEAFVYDLKSPLSTSFNPRPRYATERALFSPYDYLGCERCEGQTLGQISSSQPPTSILWQLWCEAGVIVNVKDLWDAFSAIVVEKGEDEDDEIEDDDGREAAGDEGKLDERMALALFYRGLAELRMMGFVKPTKRKVDCLAKTAWRGL
jgi:origin recognition complex subunit 3